MKTENPKAFPVVGDSVNQNYLQEGMTLRDYFAAKAMNGVIFRPDEHQNYTVNDGWLHPETIAKISYELADAMLKERMKPIKE